MTSAVAFGGRGARLAVAVVATLLFGLGLMVLQASPAFAQDETLTVTKTGVGTVTSDPPGIDCGTDCSEPYQSSTEEICIDGGACRDITTYQSVTLSASPAPGWAFQSWSGDCSGTATTCTLTVNGNESVNATFTRISPSNDDFAAAQPITGASASVSGTTKDATRETGEPRHTAAWTGDHTVWYSWTAPHTGDWNLDTCQANIDSVLVVYTGGQLDALTKLKEDNNGCSSGFGSKLTFRATAGTTYRIVVGDAGGATQNTFTLALTSIPAPPNDNFAAAQLINGASTSVNGTNVSATRESGDPWGGTGERSVWYEWTAPFSGSATFDTCTATYDSLLSVSISRWWGLEQVANANNGCSSGFGDKLTFDAQKDQTYHIAVDGCCGAPAGTFTLSLNLVDDVAPQTSIHSGPGDGSVTSSTSVTFTFDADEPDSSFKCRIYRSDLTAPAFGACSGAGRHTEDGFESGTTYTFEVRATDAAGNPDDSPAKRTFTVDATPPETTLDPSGPSGTTKTTSAAFSFSSEAGAIFECKLDRGAFTPCASPMDYTALPNGSHTFSVRAKDAAGNTDRSPARRTWTVDTIRPIIGGMSPRPASVIRDTTPTIKATVRDNLTNLQKANIKLYVAGKLISPTKYSYSAATDVLTYNSPKLSKGKKTVKVVATDAARNVGIKSWYFRIG
jgi:hypothetical protein